MRTADCREDIPSEGYETHISTRRSVSKRTLTVTVDVKENDATLSEEVLHSKPGQDSALVTFLYLLRLFVALLAKIFHFPERR